MDRITEIKVKCVLLLLLIWVLKKKLRSRRRVSRSLWVHPIYQRRRAEGQYHRLVQEMRLERTVEYKEYFRMTPDLFGKLLDLVKERITKKCTVMREAIGPAERLAVTLRFLATGNSYRSIGFEFRIHQSTVSRIVPDVCKAIWDRLTPLYMPTPDCHTLYRVAEDFSRLWQFPNCIGAIDGKHIRIQAPANSGSLYFNYKKTFSQVLLAVVDAKYRFLISDIGAYGRQSDGNIFSNSVFGKLLLEGKMEIPQEAPVTRDGDALPYVFVGDEAFPLLENLLRPYPGKGLTIEQRVYNYRLSRARRVAENAFGIMSAKFRILRREINLSPENVDVVVQACVVLHNFLRSEAKDKELPILDFTDDALLPLQAVGRRAPSAARQIRDKFKEYFNSEAGEVYWQRTEVNRTS